MEILNHLNSLKNIISKESYLQLNEILQKEVYKTAVNSDLESLNDLVKNGFDVNTIYDESCLLVIAMQRDNADLVKYLLENGANPKLINSFAFACSKNLKMVKLIMKFGYKPNISELIAAATSDKSEIVEYLVKNGADIDGVDKDGKTIYDYCGHKMEEFIYNLKNKNLYRANNRKIPKMPAPPPGYVLQ